MPRLDPIPPTLAEQIAAEVRSEVRSLTERMQWYDAQIRDAEMMTTERARWEVHKAQDALVLAYLLELTHRANRTVRGARWGMPMTPLDTA